MPKNAHCFWKKLFPLTDIVLLSAFLALKYFITSKNN